MRTLFGFALMIAALFSPAAQSAPADVIFHHATIYTADDRLPRAEAIAIRVDRIAAIGAPSDILKLKGPSTRIVDAGGATIVPGLHDSHGHFVALGAGRQTLDLRGTTSYDQIVELVRRRTAAVPRGQWIVGRSWDQNDWSDTRWPTHDRLSAACFSVARGLDFTFP